MHNGAKRQIDRLTDIGTVAWLWIACVVTATNDENCANCAYPWAARATTQDELVLRDTLGFTQPPTATLDGCPLDDNHMITMETHRFRT